MAITPVASTTSNTLLLAGDPYRARVILENSDANRLYVLLGSGVASVSNYSFSLDQWENAEVETYKGDIYGVWASAGSGHAMISVVI